MYILIFLISMLVESCSLLGKKNSRTSSSFSGIKTNVHRLLNAIVKEDIDEVVESLNKGVNPLKDVNLEKIKRKGLNYEYCKDEYSLAHKVTNEEGNIDAISLCISRLEISGNNRLTIFSALIRRCSIKDLKARKYGPKNKISIANALKIQMNLDAPNNDTNRYKSMLEIYNKKLGIEIPQFDEPTSKIGSPFRSTSLRRVPNGIQTNLFKVSNDENDWLDLKPLTEDILD